MRLIYSPVGLLSKPTIFGFWLNPAVIAEAILLTSFECMHGRNFFGSMFETSDTPFNVITFLLFCVLAFRKTTTKFKIKRKRFFKKGCIMQYETQILYGRLRYQMQDAYK